MFLNLGYFFAIQQRQQIPKRRVADQKFQPAAPPKQIDRELRGRTRVRVDSPLKLHR
jgi:hypothetical protein